MTADDDTASICSQLEEAIKCAICWEPPTIPKVLPCQHSFCLRCLYPSYVFDYQSRRCSRDRVQCPLCRREHPVPKQGGIRALPTDHRTNVITDIVGRRRHIQGKKLCTVCALFHRYNSASYSCLTCGYLLCSDCHEEHTMRGIHSSHIQVGLYDVGSSNVMCADHPSENIQYYCGECEKVVCKICAHGVHHLHDVVDFVTVEDGGQCTVDTAEQIRCYMAGKRLDVTNYKARLEGINNDIAGDKQSVEDELQKVREEICELQKREKVLEIHLMKHEEVDTYLNDLDASMDRALGRLDQIEDIIEETVHPLKQCKNITIREMCFNGIQKVFTRAELPFRDLDMLEKQYTIMVDGYKPDDDADGIHYFIDIDPDYINSKLKIMWTKDVSAYDVQFLPDGSRSMICTGQQLKWKLNLVDFEGNLGDLPPTLSKFSESDCRLMASSITSAMCLTHRTKKDGFCLPFSVIYPDGSSKPGSILTTQSQNSLCGLTVTHSHDVVFSFMNIGFSPSGTSLRCHRAGGAARWIQNTTPGVYNGPGLVTPHYATVDPLNRIIVSDHYGGKVSIFDSSGNHLLAFPKVTLAEDDEEDVEEITPRPSGICVDSQGNIYVAFPTYEVISLFTPNGQFLRHVVATSGKARGISLCEDRYLAVGTFDCGLWLYDLKPDEPEGSCQDNDHDPNISVDSEVTTDDIEAVGNTDTGDEEQPTADGAEINGEVGNAESIPPCTYADTRNEENMHKDIHDGEDDITTRNTDDSIEENHHDDTHVCIVSDTQGDTHSHTYIDTNETSSTVVDTEQSNSDVHAQTDINAHEAYLQEHVDANEQTIRCGEQTNKEPTTDEESKEPIFTEGEDRSDTQRLGEASERVNLTQEQGTSKTLSNESYDKSKSACLVNDDFRVNDGKCSPGAKTPNQCKADVTYELGREHEDDIVTVNTPAQANVHIDAVDCIESNLNANIARGEVSKDGKNQVKQIDHVQLDTTAESHETLDVCATNNDNTNNNTQDSASTRLHELADHTVAGTAIVEDNFEDCETVSNADIPEIIDSVLDETYLSTHGASGDIIVNNSVQIAKTDPEAENGNTPTDLDIQRSISDNTESNNLFTNGTLEICNPNNLDSILI